MSTDAHIYQGLWINWSHSPLVGATLTLTNRSGAFLLAFLAFYVTLAGSQLWKIISFAAHQTRASKEKDTEDGLYHQQQAVLRNTGSPIGAVWELSRLNYKWWSLARKAFLRSSILLLLSLLVFVGSSAASVFSSQVYKSTGSEVLIQSPNCGYWLLGNDSADSAAWEAKVLNETLQADSYARGCYGGAGDDLRCEVYAARSIPWNTNTNASCPFSSGVCTYSDTAAYEMDTGPMDSQMHLGINAPGSQRITYRKVTTCAPLHLAPFMTFENVSVGAGQYLDLFAQCNIGPMNGVNWTYRYNTHAVYDEFGYNLDARLSNAGNQINAWTPIDELKQTDADISVFFLEANSVHYDAPVEDPFFAANQEFSDVLGAKYWEADDYVNSLGCVDRHQFCNPVLAHTADGGCTPLTGVYLAIDGLPLIGLDDWQMSTASRIASGMRYSNMFYSVSGRSAAALRASETVYSLDQVALPNNQWMTEVSGWFANSLAKLQQAVVEYASGPTNIPTTGKIVTSDSTIERALCASQIIRSGNYQNFSLLGVTIIIIVGTFVIFLGLTIDIVVGCMQKRAGKAHYSRLAWALDEKLQLQRMAYEGRGWLSWSGGSESVPLTTKDEKLGAYQIVNLTHPSIEPRTDSKE